MWPPKKTGNTKFGKGKGGPGFPAIERTDEGEESLGDDNTFEPKQGRGGTARGTAPVSVSRGASSGGPGRAPKSLANSGMATSTAPTNPTRSSGRGKKMFPGKQKTVRKQAAPTFPMKSFGGRI